MFLILVFFDSNTIFVNKTNKENKIDIQKGGQTNNIKMIKYKYWKRGPLAIKAQGLLKKIHETQKYSLCTGRRETNMASSNLQT